MNAGSGKRVACAGSAAVHRAHARGKAQAPRGTVRFPSPAARSRRPAHAKGFTLLEVIAAVLLLAITFASLMRVAGSSLTLTARSAERSEAAMWARSLLDSAFVLEPIRPGRRSGRFDDRYRWRLDVQPFQPPATAQATSGPQPRAPASPLRLYKIDLDVLWNSAGHAYTARFSTLRVGGPPPRGAGT